jgi:hypothetical protein
LAKRLIDLVEHRTGLRICFGQIFAHAYSLAALAWESECALAHERTLSFIVLVNRNATV